MLNKLNLKPFKKVNVYLVQILVQKVLDISMQCQETVLTDVRAREI